MAVKQEFVKFKKNLMEREIHSIFSFLDYGLLNLLNRNILTKTLTTPIVDHACQQNFQKDLTGALRSQYL